MHMRCGYFYEAEQIVRDALKIHFATGRLWAVLIQIQHSRCSTRRDFDEVMETFK